MRAVVGRPRQPEQVTLPLARPNRQHQRQMDFLSAVDELKRLPGAGSELIEAIEPYVSVYNFREQPDFGLAPGRLRSLIAEGQAGLHPTPWLRLRA